MAEDMSEIEDFCQTVRNRSDEHRLAVQALQEAGAFGVVVSVLRQELDSMVRVLYLLTVHDQVDRARLVRQSLAGERWTTPHGSVITDRMMARRANEHHGWAQIAYRFGCAFIHLSRFHNYLAREPLATLPPSDRNEVLRYLREYHGGPTGAATTFDDIVPYLPAVFDKIRTNLDAHLQELDPTPLASTRTPH